MKALTTHIRRLTEWLDQRSPRERIMLLAAVLALGVFFSYAFYFNPQAARRSGIAAQIAELNTTLAALDTQAEAIKTRGQTDPDQAQRVRLEQLQVELDQLHQRLRDATVDMISPREMAGVLRDLLVRQKGLQLLRLENLPAEVLLPSAEKESGADDVNKLHLYRHPMRIVFSGTYLQTLEYLRALEKLPRRLFWDDLEIVVKDHPRAEIALTVHTLSLHKEWIGA